jgi:hypothetical protein
VRPAIASPDVNLWFTTWLRSQLAARSETVAANVFVSDETPNPRRDRMVIVRRDGGLRRDYVLEDPSVGVNVWARTKKDCSDLAHLVQALMVSAEAEGPIVTVRSVFGPSTIPDESGQPRRYLTFDVTVRCQEI